MFSGTNYENVIDYWCTVSPDNEALVAGSERHTYASLSHEITKYEHALRVRGLSRGDCIVTVLRNGLEFVALFFAALKIGCPVVPCDTAIDAHLLRHRVCETGAKLVIVSHVDQAELARRAEVECEVITIGFEFDTYSELFEYELIAISDLDDEAESSPTELALIAYTSGTTGEPKGAFLTASGLFGCARSIALRAELCSADRIYSALPFSHMFGLVVGMLSTFLVGSCLFTEKKFSPQNMLSILEAEQITAIHGVPTMFFKTIESLQLLDSPPDLSSLRIGVAAGAFVSCFLVEQCEELMGLSLLSAYGSTESIAVSMVSESDSFVIRQETVGKLLEGVEVKIVDSDGCALDNGLMGELKVKSYAATKEYVCDPLATKLLHDDDGWMVTGDLASIDAEGYLRILGRKKDLIIRGGNNVSPTALERLYLNHPSVREIAVMGRPDEVLGEKIVCFVALRNDEIVSLDDLRSYAKDRLPKFSFPDELIIMKELPKLPNGKINRSLLKKQCS